MIRPQLDQRLADERRLRVSYRFTILRPIRPSPGRTTAKHPKAIYLASGISCLCFIGRVVLQSLALIGRLEAYVIVGYARTSTTDQNAGLAAQERDLRAAGAEKVYAEQVSSIACRAKLAECLDVPPRG